MERLTREQEPKPGTRVIAISHAEGDTLYIFGYGVYEGYFIPPIVNFEEELKLWKAELKRAHEIFPSLPNPPDSEIRQFVEKTVSNPRIKLDNGKTVWGYECWWSNVEDIDSVDEMLDKKIVEIDIDAERKKHIN